MRKQLRKSIALLLLLSVLFMYVPLVSAASGGKGDSTISTQQRKAAVEAIAEYLTGHADWSGRMLQKFCYEPSVAPPTWRHYPAVRKLAIAYEAAEAANPGIGGDMLLALLSKSLAQQYEAVRQERSLFQYLKMRVSKQTCMKFRNVEKKVYLSELPDQVRRAIKTIADYSTSGPLGSPQAVIRFILRDNLKFTEDDAEGFLCQSDTVADAMTRAASFVPARVLDARLRELTARLVPHNEAARYEPSLKPYMMEPGNDNSLFTGARLRSVEPPPSLEVNYRVLSKPRKERLPVGEFLPTTPSARPDPLGPSPDMNRGLGKQPRRLQPTLTRSPSPVSPVPRPPRAPKVYRPSATPYEPAVTPRGSRVADLKILPPRAVRNVQSTPYRPPVVVRELPKPQWHPPVRTNPSPRIAPSVILKPCP